MKEILDIERRGLWGVYFASKYKTLLIWGTKKLYWRSVLWVWDGLYEFFKFTLRCYNIFKIKNILILSINLSLSKKNTF